MVTPGPLSSRFTIDDLSALAFGEDLPDMTARELQADIGALGRHSWFGAANRAGVERAEVEAIYDAGSEACRVHS